MVDALDDSLSYPAYLPSKTFNFLIFELYLYSEAEKGNKLDYHVREARAMLRLFCNLSKSVALNLKANRPGPLSNNLSMLINN